MRLTQPQQTAICQTVAQIIGSGARIWLFGSRRDDSARGGDLDLLVENDDLPSIMQRASIKSGRVGTLFVPTLLMQFLRGHDKAVPTLLNLLLR